MEQSDNVETNSTEKSIWTVGHSTHTIEQFKLILISQNIEALVDVRAFPVSRRYSHFNRDALMESMNQAGLTYQHLAGLGGRRRPSPDSRNTAWINPSFRAYADYMETSGFQQSIETLVRISQRHRAAIMCAEAVWWRCHRSLIADYLKSKGWKVIHILNEKKTEIHPYTSAASIVDGKLLYGGLLREVK